MSAQFAAASVNGSTPVARTRGPNIAARVLAADPEGDHDVVLAGEEEEPAPTRYILVDKDDDGAVDEVAGEVWPDHS